ncbi:MAG: PDZ domain-containing protein [Cyanobacteria bacterium J06621_15]
MKRLLLPLTILFTTTLGISSATLAQTSDESVPNSPNPEATEQPIPNSKPNQQQKAFMGIQMLTLNPKVIEKFNSNPDFGFKLPNTEGIFILKVFPNSAAATAGLRQGDVIKEISEKSTTIAKDVLDVVNKSSVGDTLNLKVQRDEEIIPLSVELGERPAK